MDLKAQNGEWRADSLFVVEGRMADQSMALHCSTFSEPDVGQTAQDLADTIDSKAVEIYISLTQFTNPYVQFIDAVDNLKISINCIVLCEMK